MPDPGNPLAYDRYAYTLNNPINYCDPSGHCIGIVAGIDTIICIDIVIGVATLALLVSNPEATADVMEATADLTADTLDWVSEQVNEVASEISNGINIAFHKRDRIPDILIEGEEYRRLWGDAAEEYKYGNGVPKDYQLPDALGDYLAELINEGKSIEEAVNAIPELDDFLSGEWNPDSDDEWFEYWDDLLDNWNDDRESSTDD